MIILVILTAFSLNGRKWRTQYIYNVWLYIYSAVESAVKLKFREF